MFLKIFSALRSQWANFEKLQFSSFTAMKVYKMVQNHPRGAFGAIKIDWRVVRSPRLLSRIAMDLRMSAKAYIGISSPLKNFLRDFKVRPLIPKDSFYITLPSKWVSNSKNALSDAFWSAAIDWDVGWSPRLLFQIGLVLRMLARNYNAISSCLENFLKHFEVPWLISQNGIFAWFWVYRLQNGYETSKITRELRLES